MKMILSPSHGHHFQQNGEICFENCPIDFQKILHTKSKNPSLRDLWRQDPFLKKLITYTIAPIAFELTGKSTLRLACDQWIETPPTQGYIQEFFCFQRLAIIFVVFESEENKYLLKALHPSHLNSKIPNNSYLVAFTFENARIINNPKDPFTILTRNLGYVYGDQLLHQFHPLITQK